MKTKPYDYQSKPFADWLLAERHRAHREQLDGKPSVLVPWTVEYGPDGTAWDRWVVQDAYVPDAETGLYYCPACGKHHAEKEGELDRSPVTLGAFRCVTCHHTFRRALPEDRT